MVKDGQVIMVTICLDTIAAKQMLTSQVCFTHCFGHMFSNIKQLENYCFPLFKMLI